MRDSIDSKNPIPQSNTNKIHKLKSTMPLQEIIITAGSAYVDIDVLASSIALREVLHAQGIKASICHTGPMNATIPKDMATRVAPFIQTTPPTPLKDTSFILVDVSDPNHFEKFVDAAKIYKIFDHHFGYESYWQERLGDKAIIQPIGACATLIWQEYKKHPPIVLSPLAGELLAMAILSNTLNLKASVTTDQDREALSELENSMNLSPNWRETYYEQTQATLIHDLDAAIASDTKHIHFQGNPLNFCQLEAWHGQDIIKNIPVKEVMGKIFPDQSWMISLLDVSQGINWIWAKEETVLNSLQTPLNLQPREGWFCSNKLWLRKEILKYWQQPILQCETSV